MLEIFASNLLEICFQICCRRNAEGMQGKQMAREIWTRDICLRFASKYSADGMLWECKGSKWSEKSGQEISKRSFFNANYRELSVNYREIIIFL